MVLDSVKDKITKEYLRQSQIKNKIQTKANARTGTPTICPVGLDTDNWNAYYLHLLNWIQTKATPALEHLPFAPLDWIQTTGTLTICPVGLDTDNWNAYHLHTLD